MHYSKKQLNAINIVTRLFCAADKKVAYFITPKAACQSFRRVFPESEESREELISEMAKMSKIYGADQRIYSSLRGAGSQSQLKESRKKIAKKYLTKIEIWESGKDGNWFFQSCDNEGQYMEKPLSQSKINDYFIFTFVRNPFERLVSCFQNKYFYPAKEKIFRSTQILDPIKVKDFSDFVFQISKIKNEVADPHFQSQWFRIEILRMRGIKLNFIGRLENVAADFAPIQKKYGLLPLETINSSAKKAQHKKWEDYYTPELARIVYERYAQDFENLGYKNEYPKLLHYIRENHPNKWSFHWRKRKLLAHLGIKKYKKYFNPSPI